MKGFTVSFRNSDTATRVAFATVVSSESVHSLSAVLMSGQWFDPLFGRLGLEVALQFWCFFLELAWKLEPVRGVQAIAVSLKLTKLAEQSGSLISQMTYHNGIPRTPGIVER